MNRASFDSHSVLLTVSMLIMFGLLQGGCATTGSGDVDGFQDGLRCGLSRKDVYDLCAAYGIDRYFCTPTPICPPEDYVAYDCWAQESETVFKLRFTRNDRLTSYKVGHTAGLKKINFDSERDICESK